MSRPDSTIPNKVHRRVSGGFSDIANTLDNQVNQNNDSGFSKRTFEPYISQPGPILKDIVKDKRQEPPSANNNLNSTNHLNINSINNNDNAAGDSSDLAVLTLAPFVPAPWLDFGGVVVGTKKEMAMMIENPSDRIERLALDSNCKIGEKGFSITQLDPLLAAAGPNSDPVSHITIPPRSKVEINISWTPLSAGITRAIAVLRANSSRPIINLRGRGDFPILEYQSLPSTKKALASSVRGTKIYGSSGSVTGASYTPKQSTIKTGSMRQSTMRHSTARPEVTTMPPAPSGYSTLPYVTTNEMYDEKWIDKQERSFSQWLNHEFNVTVDSFSPKDPASWSYYSHKLEFEHTRSSACKIYQSDTFRIVLRKVEESIGRDRLQLRADTNLIDVRTRREIIDLFFSFDIRWLVLGLETITGKATAMNPNFDRSMTAVFMNKAIFHDAQLEQEYEPDRILSNRPKFTQAMNRLVLKRMFMLILFLDKAKLARLIPSDPCLFNKKMKFPTLSKSHMQQNVNLALRALERQGISLEGTRGGVVGARDIVEGHREKTFGLLWKLILNWKVSVLLDLKVLEAEIDELKKEYRRLRGVDQPDRVDTVYFTSDQLSALLRWCQAIGIFYGISIDNFTTSFSDGRGFGALLSYYHPTLLDMADMKDSAKFLEEYKQGKHRPEANVPEANDSKGWFIDTKDIKDPLTVAKEMDRFNYRLLHVKVQALGGVPISLRHADMLNIGVPDEKAVILFVTYLCARLMHLNKDIRAAKTIQRIWRKKHYGRQEESRLKATVVIQRWFRSLLVVKRERDDRQRKEEAALMIQTGCRAYLAQIRALERMDKVVQVQRQCKMFLIRKRFMELRWAALTVQRMYRGHVVRQQVQVVLNEYRAVQAIQAHTRGHLVRRRFLLLRLAVDVVQTRRRALVEGREVRAMYLELKMASIVLQRHWRAILAGRAVRQELHERQIWALQIQSQIRGAMVRATFQTLYWASTVIQRHVRERALTRTAQAQFQELRWAATVIQTRWQAELAKRALAKRAVQQQYQELLWATIKIQSVVQRWAVQRQYQELRAAAVICQRRRRALLQGRAKEREFLDLRYAARVIQERWRALVLGRQVRIQYNMVRNTIIGVQATIRGVLLRQRLYELMRKNQAAMMIQAVWRGYVQRREYLWMMHAAIKIQQTWRAVQSRRQVQHEFKEYQWAAHVIQQQWRARVAGRVVREAYQELRSAAVTIQAHWRGRQERQQTLALLTVVRVQAMVRMRIGRWQFLCLREAALCIQERWRARQLRNQQQELYRATVWASIVMQRRWRALVAGREARQQYLSIRTAVVATQAQVRGAMVRSTLRQLEWATVTIQRRWRARVAGREQRQQFLEMWMASRRIQAHWRSVLEMRQVRQAFLDLRWASQVIQQRWRDIVDARLMREKMRQEREEAAVMIQAAVRGYLLRNRLLVYLEDRRRVVEQWVELSSLSLSAMVIQRVWRQYRARKEAEVREMAAVMVQRWWREQLERQRSDRLHSLVLGLQTQIRGGLARKRVMRELEATVLIQSWWRGHVVRQAASAKLKAARKRIEHANATAEEHMKLGNRTTMALDILLSSGQLSAVLKACYHLDVVTRLSKNSCLRLVEHNVVSIIFQLIKSCNRSQPHMEVMKHSLNIIENLSRDGDTSSPVFWAKGGIEILVDTAQAYRENDMVFDSVMTILLLHLEGSHGEHVNRRRTMKTMAPECKKLRGVLTVMERKVERETRSRPGVQHVSSKQTAQTAMLVQSVNKLRRIVELLH
ncbi:hypothetical protein BGZ94_010017 [Podila epigama]|nr:hypothetical protein BGZ94_010017 [Podila epigama]